MKRPARFLELLVCLALPIPHAAAALPAAHSAPIGYLVTNDDYGLGVSDTSTFFAIAPTAC